uniref:Uncharacterized protein n=1 Tax=Arundo donax TaxID=35708 RepID=A0A0A9HRH4_ARUDO
MFHLAPVFSVRILTLHHVLVLNSRVALGPYGSHIVESSGRLGLYFEHN